MQRDLRLSYRPAHRREELLRLRHHRLPRGYVTRLIWVLATVKRRIPLMNCSVLGGLQQLACEALPTRLLTLGSARMYARQSATAFSLRPRGTPVLRNTRS